MNVSILWDKTIVNPFSLAPNAGSGIMEGQSKQGMAGNTDEGKNSDTEPMADADQNPYTHLGISDADYQAYMDGKLTENELLGIANAESLYKAASELGSGKFMYQNEAHKQAANLRAKYDPNYIHNDTYDYTHNGLVDPNSIEPVPGAPKYEVLTSLPKAETQDVQVLDKNGAVCWIFCFLF